MICMNSKYRNDNNKAANKLEQETSHRAVPAAMIILHFHLQPQFKNELFHIYFTSFHFSREI